jgi:hypothetical protein
MWRVTEGMHQAGSIVITNGPAAYVVGKIVHLHMAGSDYIIKLIHININ